MTMTGSSVNHNLQNRNLPPMSTGQLATLACMLEVTIPKPGNVHRSADFVDTTLYDFLVSAIAIGPAMENSKSLPLGQTILDATRATRHCVSVNTNLGIVLLLAPLASVAAVAGPEIESLLRSTSLDDCQNIFEAIRISKPGGLGQSNRHDVNASGESDGPGHILDAMALAADRDMVARQYTNAFEDVIEFVLPAIENGLTAGLGLTDSVIHAHLLTMSEFPDSLIARKNGVEIAGQSAARAAEVLSSGQPGDPDYLRALGELDFWLRSDGNRRNPGTTADLIAAALFAGFRRQTIQPPGSSQEQNNQSGVRNDP